MGKCESIVHMLLECFAVGLGMPYDDFKKVLPYFHPQTIVSITQ